MNDATLRQQAYRKIQDKLLAGELRAGDVISEQSLAIELGMSRTPVREAIGQLQLEGLFDKMPRVGTVVRLPDRRELSELYEVREALESHAAASARLNADDLATMEHLQHELLDVAEEMRARELEFLDENLLHRFFNADIGFHFLIVRATGNAHTLRIVSEFRVIQRVFEYERVAHGARLVNEAAAQHGGILAALHTANQGANDAARLAMAAHVRASKNYALQAFERRSARGDNSSARPALPVDVARHVESFVAEARKPQTHARRRARALAAQD